jgi:hypothetical protein
MDCLDCYITITRPRSTHFSSLALQSNLLLSTSYLPLSAFCPDKTLLLRQHRSRIMSLMGNIFSIAAIWLTYFDLLIPQYILFVFLSN